MNIISVIKLAKSLMDEHGLTKDGWRFKLDNSKRRFGCCNYTYKEISLSKELSTLNSEHHVKDTILHEIAHALVGHRHGHNNVWKEKALSIGCNGERCYSTREVNQPDAKYVAVCVGCGHEHKRHKAPKKTSSCGMCSGGKYNPNFKLNYKTT